MSGADAAGASRPATYRWLAAPVGLALAVRATVLVAYERSALGPCLGTDPAQHFEAAVRIARGAWGEGHGLFSGGPLYPYFLGAVFRVLGVGTLAPRVVQALVGTATVALVAVLGARLFSRRVAIIGACAYSLSAPLVLSELGLEGEFLATFTAAAALVVLTAERPGRVALLGGGALLGATALVRGNLVLAGAFVATWLALRARPLRAAVASVALVAAGAALAIAPVAVRNFRLHGELLPLGAHGGYVFYLGHHPGATYRYDRLPFGDSTSGAEFMAAWSEANRRAGRELTPGEVSAHWFREGVRAIADDPARLGANLVAKVRAFLSDYELPDNYDLAFAREQVPPLRLLFVSWGLASTFAAVGLLRVTRRTAVLAAVPAASLATVLLFYFNARFRLPALPFLLPFAADGLVFLAAMLRERNRAFLRAAPVAGIAAVAAFWPPMHRDDRYFAYVLVGRCASGRDPASAERWLGSAIELHPREPEARVALARVLADRGDFERAEATLAPVEGDPAALALRAEIARARGRAGAGIQDLEETVRRQPNLASAQNELGIRYAEAGRVEDARAAFDRALAADPGFAEANVNAGILALERGEPLRALALFERALERMRTKDVLLMACDAARRSGDLPRARAHADAARRLGASEEEIADALR